MTTRKSSWGGGYCHVAQMLLLGIVYHWILWVGGHGLLSILKDFTNKAATSYSSRLGYEMIGRETIASRETIKKLTTVCIRHVLGKKDDGMP